MASVPSTCPPAPVHPPVTADGTLRRGCSAASPKVSEPLLRDFLDAMSALEADLARRWVGAQGRPALCGAE
ncbi:hypothetical protein [Streptomyces sp. NPDC004065]|uniref:hypothetical protein n=1 Tax=Streptomyces sp. NPDC004065 TaxID=3364689 RepID=UPI00384B315C